MTRTTITHTARLRIPADCDAGSTQGEQRMTQRIDALRSNGADSAIDSVAFHRSSGDEAPSYELSVTGQSEEAVLRELARLTLALVVHHPVTHVAWLPENALLDRRIFLNVLTPTPRRLVHHPRSEPVSDRPSARKAVTAPEARALETAVRAGLCRPLERSEVTEMRADLGIPDPRRRLARAALAVTSVVVAMNATGAMADVLSMVGML